MGMPVSSSHENASSHTPARLSVAGSTDHAIPENFTSYFQEFKTERCSVYEGHG
jgi:hypothetical protein